MNAAKIGTVLVAAAAIAGCGGSSTKTSTLDPATFAERYCALFAPCCTDVGVTQGGSCRTIIGNNATGVGRTGELGETCLAELKTKFDGFGFCNFSQSSTPSCDKVLGQVAIVASGTIAPGGACTDTPSCAPSARGATTCTFDVSVTPFVMRCQELIPGARGDSPCIGTLFENGGMAGQNTFIASGYSCAIADGLYCESGTNACAPLLQVGAACGDIDSFACTPNDCSNGVCTARIPLGGSCANGICVDTASCNTTLTCAAKKPLGAACEVPPDCLLSNCQGGVCTTPWDAGALGYLCAP